MLNKIMVWLAGIATAVAALGSQACLLTLYADETETPKSLIK